MSEPVATMLLRDAVSSTTRDAAKDIGMARRNPTDVLLLQRPAGLDRVEVGRVRRQIDDANAACSAGRLDPRIVMGLEVVHDDDVAVSELWQQLVLHPRNEAVLVRGCEHTREHHPPVRRIAPSNVRFLPQFIGIRSMSSSPRFTHAWLRLIDTFIPDSSRNTSRSIGTRRIFLRYAARLTTTSGRRLSSGRRRFFLQRNRADAAHV